MSISWHADMSESVAPGAPAGSKMVEDGDDMTVEGRSVPTADPSAPDRCVDGGVSSGYHDIPEHTLADLLTPGWMDGGDLPAMPMLAGSYPLASSDTACRDTTYPGMLCHLKPSRGVTNPGTLCRSKPSQDVACPGLASPAKSETIEWERSDHSRSTMRCLVSSYQELMCECESLPATPH